MSDITRNEIVTMVGGRRISLNKVSFSDLGRDYCYRLTVASMTPEVWQKMKEISRSRTYHGKHIILS